MPGVSKLPIRIVVAEDSADGDVGERVEINNVREVDDDGLEMRLTDWSGWTDTPDVRANPADIPGGDGSYDDEPLKASRTVTLRGVCRAPSVDALVERGELMNRLLIGDRQRRRGTVSVQRGDRPWQLCRIRLGGPTSWKDTHAWPQARAEWSMSLYAADATRYAVEEQTRTTVPYRPSSGLRLPLRFPIIFGPAGDDGLVRIVNGGSVATGLQLLIAGACVNPQIVQPSTGIRYALRTTMLDGESMLVDTGDRSCLRDGVSPWGWAQTSDSDFMLAPKGESTLLFLTDSGTPSLTVTWRDANP